MPEEKNIIKSISRRNIKDTIFTDLFKIPAYQLQLVKALHPEDENVTEKDIKLLTIQHIFVNGIYNDLGLLVRNKLLLLVEAQSTWSINILIRLLLYLSTTYQDYITAYKFSLYSSTKIEIPEPEFYIIYTGKKKVKDKISLREEFWDSPNLDLSARVIHAENKNDILGQYIIFCHVFDQQRKIYGHASSAIENTIRICQNSDVLKEYLESRKKEVMDIMFVLFDQEYNTEVYVEEEKQKALKQGLKQGKLQGLKQGKLQGAIEALQDTGLAIEKIIDTIAKKFNLSEQKAASYVHEFWQK